MVTQYDVDEKLAVMSKNPTYREVLHLFDKGFNSTNLKSRITRAVLTIGAPLDIDGTRYSD